MRLGVPVSYGATAGALGYSPLVGVSEAVEHRRYSGAVGQAEVTATWTVDLSLRSSSVVDFVYFSGARGMIDGGLTTVRVDDGTTTRFTSVNMQSGSPIYNNIGDLLLSENVNSASWAQFTSASVGIEFDPNSNSVQPDHAIIHAGKWIEGTACPIVDATFFNAQTKELTINYQGLSNSVASQIIREVTKIQGHLPIVVYDDQTIIPSGFTFQCVAVSALTFSVSQNEIYDITIRGVLV